MNFLLVWSSKSGKTAFITQEPTTAMARQSQPDSTDENSGLSTKS